MITSRTPSSSSDVLRYRDMTIVQRREYHRQHAENNKDRRHQLERIRRDKRKQEYGIAQNNAMLVKKYGITLDTYKQMLVAQGGVCYVCKCSSKRPLHVDHNHQLNRVRKLLCNGCNISIGVLESVKYPLLLNYLKEHLS